VAKLIQLLLLLAIVSDWDKKLLLAVWLGFLNLGGLGNRVARFPKPGRFRKPSGYPVSSDRDNRRYFNKFPERKN